MKSAADIRDRFATERAYVVRYVEFLRREAAVRSPQTVRLFDLLRRHGISVDAGTPMRRGIPRNVEPFPVVQAQIPALEEKIKLAQAEVARLALTAQENKQLEGIHVDSAFWQWIEYFQDTLNADSTPADVAEAKRAAQEQQALNAAELGHERFNLSSQEFDLSIRTARWFVAEARESELTSALKQIERLELATRMQRPDTEINIVRQGFILLMTAFDAAVFDLTRVAIAEKFFKLIAAFADKETISYKELAEHTSFEGFREAQIEKRLKTFYLRDVLDALSRLGVECVAAGGAEKFVHLIELVNRRNLHVHNRGIVDEHYLGLRRDGKAQFNIYNLQLGSIASIDKDYFERAVRLCDGCVELVATWAGAQGEDLST